MSFKGNIYKEKKNYIHRNIILYFDKFIIEISREQSNLLKKYLSPLSMFHAWAGHSLNLYECKGLCKYQQIQKHKDVKEEGFNQIILSADT